MWSLERIEGERHARGDRDQTQPLAMLEGIELGPIEHDLVHVVAPVAELIAQNPRRAGVLIERHVLDLNNQRIDPRHQRQKARHQVADFGMRFGRCQMPLGATAGTGPGARQAGFEHIDTGQAREHLPIEGELLQWRRESDGVGLPALIDATGVVDQLGPNFVCPGERTIHTGLGEALVGRVREDAAAMTDRARGQRVAGQQPGQGAGHALVTPLFRGGGRHQQLTEPEHDDAQRAKHRQRREQTPAVHIDDRQGSIGATLAGYHSVPFGSDTQVQPALTDLHRVGHAGREPGHFEDPALKPQARRAAVLTEALDLVMQHG